MNRKIVLLTLFSLLLACLLVTPPIGEVAALTGSGEATIIRVEPQNITRKVEEVFNIGVKVEDVINLYSLSINFSWDPLVLDYQNHQVKIPVENYPEGVLHEPVDIDDTVEATGGRYAIYSFSSDPAPAFNGTGVIFEMTFKVRKDLWVLEDWSIERSSCLLKIDSSVLADKEGNPIQHEVQHSHFKVLYAVVRVHPQSVFAGVGETITVSVVIENLYNGTVTGYLGNWWPLGNLYGLDIKFSWNPTVLEHISHKVTIPREDYPDPIPPSPHSGILHKPFDQIVDKVNATAGTYHIAYASMNPAEAFNGNGTVFTITFKVVKKGASSLDLTKIALGNQPTGEVSKTIVHQKEDGQFETVPLEHDVAVFLEAPMHTIPGTSVCLNATALNVGLNKEVDVELRLLINGSLVNSTVIALLEVNASHLLSYIWTPMVEAFYNVTAYASPVHNEIDTLNNVESKAILVSKVIRVPLHYLTIQEAINIASSGDTIQVEPGTYEHIVIDKSLTLLGKERNTTIIDAQTDAIAVSICANEVRISGFTIQSGLWGIKVFMPSTAYHSIEISNNIIRYNGASIVFLSNASNCVIEGNLILDNNEAGVEFSYGHNNTISRNTISNLGFGGFGIYLYRSRNITIKGNVVSNTDIGIFVEGWHNAIWGNTVQNNGVGMKIGWKNEVHYNNFVNNTVQISPAGNNTWHHNYWSDYEGEDLDGDGIGDTLLPHQGVDSYPLIDTWTPIPGDVDLDNKVTIYDVVIACSAYGSKEGYPNWNPLVDLASPWGIINIYDIVTITYHFGKTYP